MRGKIETEGKITPSHSFQYFLVSFYISLPVVIISLISWRFYNSNPSAGLILFLVEFLFVYLLCRLPTGLVIILAPLFLVLLKTGLSILLGRLVHPNYLKLIFYLEINPYLSLGLYLLRKHVIKRYLEKARWPINLALILFLSSFLLTHTFTIYSMIIRGAAFPSPEYYYAIFNLLTSFSVIYLLFLLRRDSGKILAFSPRSLTFRGSEISFLFPGNQFLIVYLLLRKYPGRINCAEINRGINKEASFCPDSVDSNFCKPSACAQYMSVYRRINEIRKKFESLGIGTIITPDNKREIYQEGWSIRLDPQVSLYEINAGNNKNNYSIIQGQVKESTKSLPINKISLFPGVFFSLLTAAVFFYELGIRASCSFSSLEPTVILFILGLLGAVLLTLPLFIRNWKVFLILFFLGFIFFQGAAIILTRTCLQTLTLFLFLKNICLFLALFIYCFRRFPDVEKISSIKRFTDSSIFWILWSYFAALLVLRDSPDLSVLLIEEPFSPEIIFNFHDQLLLILSCLLVLDFLVYRIKILTIRGESVFLNKRALEMVVPGVNLRLLKIFLSSKEKILLCRQIVKELYPEESDRCLDSCKAALCPAYQRIYKKIQELRRVLEILDLGTIKSPPKTASAKEDGWKISLSQNVYLEMDDKLQ